mmetsp:Transcript_34667/g.84078  ORF Transcript_34667/g.84078 Transcript_34667/m.84078 type:complete len:342 (-) Transcript_34667:90-1115(-)
MLRNADFFVKPRHDLRTKSATGGLITLIAGSVAGLLFLAQMYTQIMGTTQHSLYLSESRPIPMLGTFDPFTTRLYDIKGKMTMKLHITFPHMECNNMEIRLNGAALKDADFDFKAQKGRRRMAKVRPNAVDLKEAGFDPTKHKTGCTIKATLRVPVVAGHVSITMSQIAWSRTVQQLMMQAQMGLNMNNNDPLTRNANNMTHYIHSVQFGKRFPLAKDDPLQHRAHVIENKMGGIALENIQVKLVPTFYSGLFSSKKTYQQSVVSHTVQPEHMVTQGVALLPGLAMSYDLTPLAVRHEIGRDNIFAFLSSLMSIVGGAFVTVSLFTGLLVHSAAAVAKKVD